MARESDERGFSLVEVVIGMLLLALLAVFALPSIIVSLRAVGLNTSTATAAQLLSQQLESAKSEASGDCTALDAWAAATLTPAVDQRGFSYQPIRSFTCPAGGTGQGTVTVQIVETGTSDVLAQGTTYLYIGVLE